MSDYGHVCMKDLENYIRKDSYFSDFTEAEKQEVRRNLDIASSDDLLSTSVIRDTYENIKRLADYKELQLNCTYVITDFQSIYQCNGRVLGKNIYPSKTYQIVLTPTSRSSFSKNVRLESESVNTKDWVVEYDFTEEDFITSKSKGKITYMKDLNNNSAYYDFKNVLSYRTMEELNKNGTKSYSQDLYFHTFDDGNGNDNSVNCRNNHIDLGCSDIVCLDTAENNTFEWESHGLTFYDTVKGNTLKGCHDVQFLGSTVQCEGTIHNKVISDINSLPVPKSFLLLSTNLVCMYIDPLVETLQIKTIS